MGRSVFGVVYFGHPFGSFVWVIDNDILHQVPLISV